MFEWQNVILMYTGYLAENSLRLCMRKKCGYMTVFTQGRSSRSGRPDHFFARPLFRPTTTTIVKQCQKCPECRILHPSFKKIPGQIPPPGPPGRTTANGGATRLSHVVTTSSSIPVVRLNTYCQIVTGAEDCLLLWELFLHPRLVVTRWTVCCCLWLSLE